MGCAASQEEGQSSILSLLLSPGAAARLKRSAALRERIVRELPAGLDTPVSRAALFDSLRLEDGLLVNRAFSLFDEDRDGWVSLRELLSQLARCAAGLALRTGGNAGGEPPSPRDWMNRGDAAQLQAEFAFRLFDLDDNGVLTAAELRELVTELYGSSSHAKMTVNALGAKDGAVDLQSFQTMAANAPNFMFQPYLLQKLLSEKGREAKAVLEVLDSRSLPRTPIQAQRKLQRPNSMDYRQASHRFAVLPSLPAEGLSRRAASA